MIRFATAARSTIDTERSWSAVLARDPRQDGRFVFAVRTTGVFCRPSCPARRPRRHNVEFFANAAAARGAGYRPCRRCRPETVVVDPLEIARRLVHDDPAAANLTNLARRVGLSPGHLQRRFKARYGLSPREFAAAGKVAKLRASLRSSGSVSRATYDAGYQSSSQVYAGTPQRLGMRPAEYARGGAGQVIRYTIVAASPGPLLVAATERGVCAVLLGRDREQLVVSLRAEFPRAQLERVDAGADDFLQGIVRQVEGEIEGRIAASARPPLDLIGTEFQLRVWKALLRIPRGTTRSYTEIARAIGERRAARAVGSAIGRNRLAVLVPCHRVIRADGSMGGYRWGIPLKEKLVAAERAS